jgi:hypothetical protein
MLCPSLLITYPSHAFIIRPPIMNAYPLNDPLSLQPSTDRTGGAQAVADFQPFVDAGITSFDMADHYGMYVWGGAK